MRIWRGDDVGTGLPRGAVVTIGNFDGLHLGQRALVAGAVARARELGTRALVLTFEPHSRAVLDPANAPARILSDAQRIRLLAELGVGGVWIVPFTRELARSPAVSFVSDLLVERLGVREVHVGSRFSFGRGREGNLALLERLGREHGFAARGVAEVRLDGEPVSSTRVRAALASGEVELAARLLGRPFARAGRIVAGDRLGRQIGWPTANLEADVELMPVHGVYAAKLRRIQRGEVRPGVANVGVRPTRGGDAAPRVEIHLFDFAGELYGEEVEIEFHARLRAERRFPSLEALSAQIAADAAGAREYFAAARRSEGVPGAPAGGPPERSPLNHNEKRSQHGQ
jgi:riboflavin kinase / FMN adenylyltransferase